METKLRLITEIAVKDRKCRFNNLVHMLNVEGLRECFYLLKKDKASGIDNVTFEEYEKDLEANLQNLVERMKRFSCQATACAEGVYSEIEWQTETSWDTSIRGQDSPEGNSPNIRGYI